MTMMQRVNDMGKSEWRLVMSCIKVCLNLKGCRLPIGVPLYEQGQTQECEIINYAFKRDAHRHKMLLGCKLEL